MKTCSGDLPGQQQSCLHPGRAALASPSINSVVKRSKERGKAIWGSILTSLWMKGILLLTKCFHWCGSISPPQRRISTQLLIKNPSDSLRLGLHYASADNVVTADTFYNYCEFQCMPPLWQHLVASSSLIICTNVTTRQFVNCGKAKNYDSLTRLQELLLPDLNMSQKR